jgi:hypothetical protein
MFLHSPGFSSAFMVELRREVQHFQFVIDKDA